MKHPILPKLPRSITWPLCISVAPIALFAAFTVIVGGDALSGTIQHGHYFVRERSIYKEVSRVTFLLSATFSLLAAIGVFVIANRVLRFLDLAEITSQKPLFRKLVNWFFAFGCGSLAIWSVCVIVRTLAG